MSTAGVKFDAWVAQARALGLVVEIEWNHKNPPVMESVTARISRPQVEEHNALDSVRNAEWVSIHAVRCGGGKWSNNAGRYALGIGYHKIPSLRSVRYWIESMAD